MRRQHRFETERENVLRRAVQIRELIVRLSLSVQTFNWDIEAEQERARVHDPSDSTYPVIARAWAKRRDNLKVTIAELQRGLDEANVAANAETA